MAQTVVCFICKEALDGVIKVIPRSPGRVLVVLFRETPDGNWTQCKKCGRLICKACGSVQPGLCCKEVFETNHDDPQEKSESAEADPVPIEAAA